MRGRAGLLLLAFGCSAPSRLEPLEVEYWGCASLPTRGSEVGCAIPAEEPLRLEVWVASEAPETPVVTGAKVLERAERDYGALLRLEVSPGTTAVLVEAARGRWVFPTQTSLPAPEGLAHAERLAAEQQWSAAAAIAGEVSGWAPVHRAAGWRLLAGIARAEGDFTTAQQRLARAVRLHRARGDRLAEARDIATMVYTSVALQRDFSAARDRLAELGDTPVGAAEAAFYADYSRGLLASRSGDHRRATRYLRAAATTARRLDQGAVADMADEVQARSLRAAGRFLDAIRVVADIGERVRAADDTTKPCRRLQVHINLADHIVGAWEAGVPPSETDRIAPRPRRLLEQAARWNCDDASMRAVLALNQALLAWYVGDLHGGQAQLDALVASGAPLDPGARMWSAEIAGRIALSAGNTREALAAFQRAQRVAERAVDSAGLWRAWVGQARSLDALGRARAAHAAWAEAERLVYAHSLLFPGHDGRVGFLAQRERATRDHVASLLRAGEVATALRVVRVSRAQYLASVRWDLRIMQLDTADQRAWDAAIAEHRALRSEIDDLAATLWSQPASRMRAARAQIAALQRRSHALLDEALLQLSSARPEPRTLRPGELLLAFVPLADQLVALTRLDDEVDAVRLGAWPSDALLDSPARLLRPVASLIERAQRVALLVHPDLAAIDFHALPVRGRPLAAQRPVAYILDLEVASGAGDRPGGIAVVVGDPRDDLPQARTEAARVIHALNDERGPARVRALLGSAANRSATLSALNHADLLHYAGHGQLDVGWRSGLPLADATTLDVGDILALPAAPARVILSGCETGRDVDRAGTTTLGVAQAFIAAGAREVLAAARPIDGDMALAVATALYQPEQRSPGPFARVFATLATQMPSERWSSYRLITP